MALIYKVAFPNFFYAHILETAYKTKDDKKGGLKRSGTSNMNGSGTLGERSDSMHSEDKPALIQLIEDTLHSSISVKFSQSLLNMFEFIKMMRRIMKRCPCRTTVKTSPLQQ